MTTNTINYPGISQPHASFASCTYVLSRESSTDDGQGMAVASMDLIDGAFLSCHISSVLSEAGTGSTGQLGIGFPCPGAFES